MRSRTVDIADTQMMAIAVTTYQLGVKSTDPVKSYAINCIYEVWKEQHAYMIQNPQHKRMVQRITLDPMFGVFYYEYKKPVDKDLLNMLISYFSRIIKAYEEMDITRYPIICPLIIDLRAVHPCICDYICQKAVSEYGEYFPGMGKCAVIELYNHDRKDYLSKYGYSVLELTNLTTIANELIMATDDKAKQWSLIKVTDNHTDVDLYRLSNEWHCCGLNVLDYYKLTSFQPVCLGSCISPKAISELFERYYISFVIVGDVVWIYADRFDTVFTAKKSINNVNMNRPINTKLIPKIGSAITIN